MAPFPLNTAPWMGLSTPLGVQDLLRLPVGFVAVGSEALTALPSVMSPAIFACSIDCQQLALNPAIRLFGIPAHPEETAVAEKAVELRWKAIRLRREAFLAAGRIIKDVFNCYKVQREIVVEIAELGLALKDRALLREAAVLAGRIGHAISRSDAQRDVAVKIAKLGLVLKDRALLQEAVVLAGRIEDEKSRSDAQRDVAVEIAKLGLVLKDRSLLQEAAVLAGRTEEYERFRSDAQRDVAVKMAEKGMVSEAKSLLQEAAVSAGRVEWASVRSWAQLDVAVEMMEMGMVAEARSLLQEAAVSAERIENRKSRYEAHSAIAVKMAETGIVSGARPLLLKMAKSAGSNKDPDDLSEVRPLLQEEAESARRIEEASVRSRDQREIAVKMAKVGMVAEARSLLQEAAESAEGIQEVPSLYEARREIPVKMAEIGLVLKDRSVLQEAAVLAGRIGHSRSRSDAQMEVAVKMAEMGMAFEAKSLLQEAAVSAGSIGNTRSRYEAQSNIAMKMAEVALVLKDRSLVQEAALLAWRIEDSGVQRKVAVKMAEAALVLKDRSLLQEAEELAGKIENSSYHKDDRSKAQGGVAVKMAELGFVLKDRSLFQNAVESAGRIEDTSVRSWAQREIPVKIAEVASLFTKQGTALVTPFGGFEGEEIQKRLRLLSYRKGPFFASQLSVLLDLEDLAQKPLTPATTLLAKSLTALTADDQKKTRREILKNLSQKDISPQERTILTTALRGLNEISADSAFYDYSKRRLKEISPGDPGVIPIALGLVRTGQTKSLNLATRLLGEPHFRNRFWLVKKLEEVGHLDKGITVYLKKYPADLMNRWIQGMVGELGLTPSIRGLELLVQGKWEDETGRRLDAPEEVIAYLKKKRSQYASPPDPAQFVKTLAENQDESGLYYLLFSGRTHFSLIHKYSPDQFFKMVQTIHSNLGPVHKGMMSGFEKTLAGHHGVKRTRDIASRLRLGRWPLSEQPYARSLRIDVSSESALKELKDQWAVAFTFDQLGAMVVASLHRDRIPKTNGLGELPQALQGLGEKGRKPYEEILRQLGDLGDIAAFKVRVEKNFREALKNFYRSKKNKEALEGLKEAPAEDVLVQWIKMKIGVSPIHAEEWKSHVKAVFEGVRELGAKKGEREKKVTLRYLDKGRDLVEFLRFADAAQCCFTSENQEAQLEWISRLWKDPLSFCFLIEDNDPGAGERNAVGFVFGSFGNNEEGRPIVLLNGVYLQGKTNEAVLAILNAIEEDFSRPIGATHQLVAATYGGETHLDPAHLHAAGKDRAYSNEPITVTRLRALANRQRKLENEIYDDLGVGVNQKATTEGHVWWKSVL